MVRKLSKQERAVMTRDLPDDYDPHFFYEYRIMKRSKEATGIEGFLYKLMPWSLIKSFAFAIDPLSNFKISTGKISPVNRTRTRIVKSVLDTSRMEVNSEITRTRAAQKNYLGHSGRYGPVVDGIPYVNKWTSPKGNQTPLPRYSKDTTFRTRPFGYQMGEFEKVQPQVFSRSRSIHGYSEGTQYYSVGVGQDYPDFNQSKRAKDYSVGPSAATYRLDYYTILLSQERDALLQLMQKNALAMYKGMNPLHRNYSLFRNTVELRDIPRSILTLKNSMELLLGFETLLDPKTLFRIRQAQHLPAEFFKGLSSEYLSYHFGWKQLYKDTVDLLLKPQAISRQIDFLIRRSGKATTYRTKRKFLSGRSDVPHFSYDVLRGETVKQVNTSLTRESELRMVINSTFEFPNVNTPTFRADLFAQKIGAYPRFTDLYNLVPWTWLVDWFTGLGNYVEIIDEINRDRSLINWGLITGTSAIGLTTHFTGRAEYDRSVSVNNVGTTTFTKVDSNHQSTLHIDLQLRRNVASIFDVKTTSDPGSLSPFQNSILGALISQRTKFSR